ncbi:hypothetical protein SSBR45G_23940 [Bradyrhizobium sp. SSBR45G]|uniref:hypothetical protein n=1 Tax=unclassified Bradyrhizobium TaxID=2631580 RepID=UPI002342B2AA|nr:MULTISPECIES: hypothetical protein [unclassified Bradyrhizobium]GLH77486.1 hypothetical protein SSBR45G_23940 [Bradyrhizobium sp. SSBR45G]GLH84408.1 hypothetical protein SSBR45R_18680 [Bradyrhizobium sp. SSBR45R]
MAQFDGREFDPQTYGSTGVAGLFQAFQNMMQPKPGVPEQDGGSAPRNFSPETPFSPQQDLIQRLQRQNVDYQNANPGPIPDVAPTQKAAIRAAVDAGVDPVQLYRYVNVENQKWDNRAVSTNGAVGITQIYEPRWKDIKSYLIRSGRADLADKLTDRTDPYQNALAWAYEFKHNSEQARSLLGRDPTPAETYMYWQTPQYAPKILTEREKLLRDSMKQSPNADDGEIEAIIRQNPSIYRGGNMKSEEVIDHVGKLMNRGTDAYQRMGGAVIAGQFTPPWPTKSAPIYPVQASPSASQPPAAPNTGGPTRVLRSRSEDR